MVASLLTVSWNLPSSSSSPWTRDAALRYPDGLQTPLTDRLRDGESHGKHDPLYPDKEEDLAFGKVEKDVFLRGHLWVTEEEECLVGDPVAFNGTPADDQKDTCKQSPRHQAEDDEERTCHRSKGEKLEDVERCRVSDVLLSADLGETCSDRTVLSTRVR